MNKAERGGEEIGNDTSSNSNSGSNQAWVREVIFSDKLFEIAKKDLEAAKLLYANKFYPQSVFYLQQSAEKLYKAYCLRYRIINIQHLQKKRKHDVMKIIIESLLNKLEDIKKEWEDIKRKLEDIKRKLEEKGWEDIKRELEDIKKEWEDKLTKIVNVINIFYDKLKEIKSEFYSTYNNKQKMLDISFLDSQELLTKIKNIQETSERLNKIIKENDINSLLQLLAFDSQLSDGVREFFSLINPDLKIMLLSYLLGVKLSSINNILLPHLTISRYPDYNTNYGPCNYTENVPLIKEFNSLTRLLEESLDLYQALKTNS